MKFLSKKRIVLFLLFIFPLICFLILSTGENNFTKLPIVTENVLDVNKIDSSSSLYFKDHITVVCFLGNDVKKNQSGLLSLNEKIYKKFLDYKKFQMIAVYPKGKEIQANKLKNDIAAFTDMKQWFFLPVSAKSIEALYASFSYKEPLVNLGSSKVFLVDKKVNLRGRLKNSENQEPTLYGYNLNSVAELNGKLKDDINVLFYEYYAAFKERNKNKADRKQN